METKECSAHVHMLLEIPPKMSISGFIDFFYVKLYINFLKIKSSTMLFQKFGK
ncbi:hypothetical protein H5999_03170 [[Clostridium] spiroforme]|nr:hypothetical protein [Thomasclavelia spiroformis]